MYTHTIHVWCIYLHLVDFYGFHVGKYTNPTDAMGIYSGLLEVQLVGAFCSIKITIQVVNKVNVAAWLKKTQLVS